jgi:hypothetical protein
MTEFMSYVLRFFYRKQCRCIANVGTNMYYEIKSEKEQDNYAQNSKSLCKN